MVDDQSGYPGDSFDDQFAGHERATPTDDGPIAERGWPSTICEQDERHISINPINDPEPVPASEWPGYEIADDLGLIETGRPDENMVIGVERDGEARAYPIPTLWWTEIINDELGEPLLVTYCPVCRSGIVTERRVDDTVTRFDISGLLWRPPEEMYPPVAQEGDEILGGGPNDNTSEAFRNDRRNLVMVDGETGSYWSQLLVEAICGPKQGEQLTVVPSSMTTFGEWRDRHPGTTVVLPPSTQGVPTG